MAFAKPGKMAESWSSTVDTGISSAGIILAPILPLICFLSIKATSTSYPFWTIPQKINKDLLNFALPIQRNLPVVASARLSLPEIQDASNHEISKNPSNPLKSAKNVDVVANLTQCLARSPASVAKTLGCK